MAIIFMPSKVLASIVKFSCEAKRTALKIRKGSSENVICGSKGVRIILFCKSYIPLKESIN